jgi:hypothetical protein
MMVFNRRRKRPDKTFEEIKDFKGASNKILDEARISPNEASTALNLMQVQDGLWKPRWGRDYYGPDLGANIDGGTEFVKSDTTTEKIVIAGGVAYKATDGGSWSAISGATFTAGVQCFFMQIAGFLYIANGTDPLTRYNGSTLAQYSEITTPTGLGGTAASSIAGSGFTIYGQVTALNDVGETVGSSEVAVTVTKRRDAWSTVTTDQIVWSWSPVTGATRYQLYISDSSGHESLLIAVTNTTYTDNGSQAINPYIQPPLQNTTAAPKFTSMVVSGNRIWGTGSTNSSEFYTVFFSGTGQYIGTFSDFFGGGYINLEKGGREIPVKVVHYQSGGGEPRATVLCRTPEGRGAIWQITISSATVGDTSFSVPTAIKVIGATGTEAPLSVVGDNNNILGANRRGFFQIGPQQNYYGILRTTELSIKIRNYWRGLLGSKISGIASYFYDNKILISVPTTSTGNNRTIVWDTERQNWTVDWSFGFKQMFEYTDTSGKTHLLYVPVSGTRLVEVSENIQGDFGSAFETNYESGRLQVAKYWKDFEKIDKVYIKLGSPRGAINFEVSGTQANLPFKSLASKTISPQFSLTGMGFDLMGDVLMGDTLGTPTTFSDASDPHYVRIRKKLRDIKFRLYTNSVEADYILQGFIIEGTPIKKNSPSAWKL